MVGLIALLDDVAGIAKVAAASLDDVAGMSVKAGAKAAGAVIDDAAVTPKYVHGFDASREVPIVWKIAKGSLFNKIVILLPLALILSTFAPWAIAPLLMVGGAYLCFEGAEKVWHALHPHDSDHDGFEDDIGDPAQLEEQRVAGAIKTDFILSAEIMTIALAAIPAHHGIVLEAIALLVVAVGITAAVYGFVGLIVKVDDYGLALSKTRSGLLAAAGRILVRGMPGFMRTLMVVGTAAMVWVGGNIVIHGLHQLGVHQPYMWIHDRAAAAAQAVPAVAGLVQWLVMAALDGVIGLALGLALIPLAKAVFAPLWNAGKRAIGRA